MGTVAWGSVWEHLDVVDLCGTDLPAGGGGGGGGDWRRERGLLEEGALGETAKGNRILEVKEGAGRLLPTGLTRVHSARRQSVPKQG